MKTKLQILKKIEDLEGAMDVLDANDTAFLEAKNRKEALEWVLDNEPFEDEGGQVAVDMEKHENISDDPEDYPNIKDLDRRKY